MTSKHISSDKGLLLDSSSLNPFSFIFSKGPLLEQKAITSLINALCTILKLMSMNYSSTVALYVGTWYQKLRMTKRTRYYPRCSHRYILFLACLSGPCSTRWFICIPCVAQKSQARGASEKSHCRLLFPIDTWTESNRVPVLRCAFSLSTTWGALKRRRSFLSYCCIFNCYGKCVSCCMKDDNPFVH